MKVDHCFILAAGFGTRMGLLGKELPKVLWPVFERTILELQVEFARSLGINSISINTHYQKDKILEYTQENKTFEGVEILVEEEILDIGGGIQNFAKTKNYSGNVLILNSDQFLMFDKAFIESLKDEGQVATLFTKKVFKTEKYNQLVHENNILKGVTPFSESKESKFDTYSGCAIVNLELLDKVSGPSAFFKSVAIFTKKKVICVDCDKMEYTDFGTKLRYFESTYAVLESKRKLFNEFLLKTNAIKKIAPPPYEGKIFVGKNYIDLKGQRHLEPEAFTFYYDTLEDGLD